ncbi:MAG: protein glxC [Planctomycetaceae bacterium]|nr:protein glxC [Planctomycetaceae bacterium]
MDRVNTLPVVDWDLAAVSVRELNQFLHDLPGSEREATGEWPTIRVHNPAGQHSIAVGLQVPVQVEVLGDGGYFLAGMNQHALVTVHGNVGWSVAENIMSGRVHVKGCASECAGASGQGGLIVIEKDTSSRCGISMKGCDIVVGGSVGHMSAFMAQAGTLVVCGDAAAGLGDSLYEATIYVQGLIHGLGADAREEPMTSADCERVATLLSRAGLPGDPKQFKRIASARSLYHWHADAANEY